MNRQIIILAWVTLALAACSSTPSRKVEVLDSPVPIEDRSISASTTGSPSDTQQGGGYLAGDGPGANVPANIDEIPDAIPVSEPLHRYANRPYVALGNTYTPLTQPGHFKERGIASWYGKKFHGQRTSSGEVYDMYAMTAAHPTLPIPSYARVTNVANQKSVVVRINDRGPFLHNRVIDLSYTAAHKLGIIGSGSAEVEIESISPNASTSTQTLAQPETIQTEPLEKSADKSPLPATTVSSSNVYLQLGAFKSQEAAESFMTKMRAELNGTDKQLSLYNKDGLVRVHIGPYIDQSTARSNAEALQGKLGFKPILNLH